MGDCPLPCLLEGILSILHSSGGCFHSFCRHKLYLHLGLRSQLNNYVTMYMIVYVIMLYIITYTHINYYIQLCDTFKPPISTGVLVVPGGTLILLKNRKAADGQDNFSESERERERNLELLAQCDFQWFCEFCECRQRFLYEPWHAVPPVSPWHIIGQESKQQ